MEVDDIMDVKQAAKALDLSVERIRQLCQEGLMGRKIAGVWLISRDEVERYRRTRRPRGRPRKGEEE